MKKILLGTAAGLFLVSANAEDTCGCADTSFTGAFIGAAVNFEFDQDKTGSNAFDTANNLPGNNRAHYATTKKNKTAFGGSLILGYGYQFSSNLYVAIMHESLFASKAKVTHNAKTGNGLPAGIASIENSRKVYAPSFGIALGYVVDGWNFGLRTGVSIDKFEINRLACADPVYDKYNKTVTATSPYVGAYVEYKIDSYVAFANVDYKFGKSKRSTKIFSTDGTAYQKITHKRPSWKLALGVKCNINNLVAKFR